MHDIVQILSSISASRDPATSSVPAAAPQPAGSAYGQAAFSVLGALSLCHLLNDMVQSLLPAIYPILKSALSLDFRHVGLITLVNQMTASLLQPLVGYYTDRRPKPQSLAIGMTFSLCGLLLLAWSTQYALVLLAAGLIGIGSSIFHPESSRIARLASGGQHGLAQSLFQVGGNAGSALGPLLAAFIVLPRGQRSLAWFAIVPITAIVLLWRVGRWYSQRARSKAATRGAAHAAPHGLTRRQVIGAMAVLLVLVFSKYIYLASLSTYYTFYLMETFHVSVRSAQLHLFVFLGAVAVGTVLGGPVGDRFGRKYVIWGSILGVLPFTLALPFASLAGHRRAQRDHRSDPRVRVFGHPRVRAGTGPWERRHDCRPLLRSGVRHRRPWGGGARRAGGCDQHHVCVPAVRVAAGARSVHGSATGSRTSWPGCASRAGADSGFRRDTTMNRRHTVRIAVAVVLSSMAMAVVLSGRGVETASERDTPYGLVARGAIRHVRALGAVLGPGRHVGRKAGRDLRGHGVDREHGPRRHRYVCETRHPALQAQAGVCEGMGATRQRCRRTLHRRHLQAPRRLRAARLRRE